MSSHSPSSNLENLFFFFNDTATTEIYTLSLHDALPIFDDPPGRVGHPAVRGRARVHHPPAAQRRSEEHTSELQSQSNLVCRLLLEKKKQGCVVEKSCFTSICFTYKDNFYCHEFS